MNRKQIINYFLKTKSQEAEAALLNMVKVPKNDAVARFVYLWGDDGQVCIPTDGLPPVTIAQRDRRTYPRPVDWLDIAKGIALTNYELIKMG